MRIQVFKKIFVFLKGILIKLKDFFECMKLESIGGILLGPGCKNHCEFCVGGKASPQHMREKELGIARDILSYMKKGYDSIEISGGDPIEYDKIVGLVRYLKKCGFSRIMMSTHGRNLCDMDFAKDLISAGITLLRIPIYGVTSEVHDSVTRSPGSFEETIQGIKNVKKINPDVKLLLHTLILQENKETLFELYSFAKSFDCINFDIATLYLPKDTLSSYVPYKDMSRYLKVFHNEQSNVLSFHEIPHCVFGKYNPSIVISTTYDHGKYSQYMSSLKTPDPNVSVYRVKVKVDACDRCSCRDSCDGFLATDLDRFGTEWIRPL